MVNPIEKNTKIRGLSMNIVQKIYSSLIYSDISLVFYELPKKLMY